MIEKRTKRKQKEAGIGPYLKKTLINGIELECEWWLQLWLFTVLFCKASEKNN